MSDTPIRKFRSQTQHVEAGPIQFNKDEPGLYLPGRNCMALLMCLERLLLEHVEVGFFYRSELRTHISLLEEVIKCMPPSTSDSKGSTQTP